MDVNIVEASRNEAKIVADLVKGLLSELEPEAIGEIEGMQLESVTANLFDSQKIFAFIAMVGNKPIGVITLHECAAIYAGGLFGEISEMYIQPEYRSSSIGGALINAAVEKGKALNWKRLEVGTPPPELWGRTVRFYERNNFEATGTRLKLPIA